MIFLHFKQHNKIVCSYSANTIFCNHLKTTILIKLKCWCKYTCNHGRILRLYLALKSIREYKDWFVNLFAMKVGARGYCSKSVVVCFKKSGFNSTFIRNTLTKSSTSCMKYSFCIWLTRNSEEWTCINNCKPKNLPKKPEFHYCLRHLWKRLQSQFP